MNKINSVLNWFKNAEEGTLKGYLLAFFYLSLILSILPLGVYLVVCFVAWEFLEVDWILVRVCFAPILLFSLYGMFEMNRSDRDSYDYDGE